MRLVDLAHSKICEVLKPGDCCIDATAGNGYDSLFLAKQVQPNGTVFCVDIQAEAIQITLDRINQHGLGTTIHGMVGSHCDLSSLVDKKVHGQVKATMFNLGYLPGGDHTVTTTPDNTVRAICESYSMTSPGGMISVLCYRGHMGGIEETDAVLQLCEANHWDTEIEQGSETPTSPLLVLIRKS